MKKINLSLNNLIHVLWGLVLFTIPVTSFKYYPAIFGSASTQPLSFLPLLVLVPLIIIKIWRSRKIHLPTQTIILLVFLSILMLSDMLGSIDPPQSIRGFTYWSRVFRAWVSLGIGLTYFVITYFVSDSEKSLQNGLKWLFAGLVATIIWGSIQGIAELTPYIDNHWTSDIQKAFSIRDLEIARVHGFALEPAWLADQLVMFSLPWLLASFLTGYKIMKNRWVQALLVLGSLIILYYSFSRNGLVIFFVSVSITLLVFFWARIRSMYQQIISISPNAKLGFWGVFVLIMAGGVYGTIALFDITSLEQVLNYIINIRAGERLSGAIAGFRLFGENPWFGVGFGSAGLYLFDYYPDWAFGGIWIFSQFLTYKFFVIPTSRNMYVRLLSETGIIGVGLFVVFLLSVLGTIRKLLTSERPVRKYLGFVGMFAWVAIVMRNITQDSFTFPVMWIMLGSVLGYDAHLPDDAEEIKEISDG